MWIAVEGNIGSGKSTLLHLMAGRGYQCLQEPVDQWQQVQDPATGETLLSAFYRQPDRYAYLFQSYTFPTRLQQLQQIQQRPPETVMIGERSIDSDYQIFGRAAVINGHMNALEATVYQSWYTFHRSMVQVEPDLVVYLRTPVYDCYRRLGMRQRPGEERVSIAYLMLIERLHESWLLTEPKSNLVVLDGLKSPSDIADDLERVLNGRPDR